MNEIKVTDLRSLARQLGMRGYSRLRKDDLIDFIKDNLSSRPPPRPAARPTQPRQPSIRFRPDTKTARIVKETRRKESTATATASTCRVSVRTYI